MPCWRVSGTREHRAEWRWTLGGEGDGALVGEGRMSGQMAASQSAVSSWGWVFSSTKSAMYFSIWEGSG